MARRKIRREIPASLAAGMLFLSDRTCCVCRTRGKPVQIHHVDDNPSNNSQNNLAVLCLDCHRDTQIRGGFDRKLDCDQVILYRDDWHRIVARQRATEGIPSKAKDGSDSYRLQWVTSTAEIYRENGEFELLAQFYDSVKNFELRDKYIELALQKDSTDQGIVHLRAMQGKAELIPAEVIDRELERYTKNKDWSQRARFFYKLGKYREAALDYVRSVNWALERGKVFGAAFYLKELVERGLIQELFIQAFSKAKEENSLWWQVRALQELNWHDELTKLLLQNAKEIEESRDPSLCELLASAKGDKQQALEMHKEVVRNTHLVIMGDPRQTVGGNKGKMKGMSKGKKKSM